MPSIYGGAASETAIPSRYIEALLDAAGQLDAEAREDRKAVNRRALLAVLTFGGLRIEEALALRWRDVDLAGGRLRVEGTKTDAAVRELRMFPVLGSELRAAKASSITATGPDDLVFCTREGKPADRTHTRSRILRPSIRRANESLVERDLVPIPFVEDGGTKAEGVRRGKSLTQHGLRHTYISLRCALGDDPASIGRDVGHADLETTFRIYTHTMNLDDGGRDRLRDLVDGKALEGDFRGICGDERVGEVSRP